MTTAPNSPSPILHPILGGFEPLDVLIEIDAPQVFTFLDGLGRECVAYLAEAGADHSIYLAASINPEILAEIAAGHLPVLAAFRSRVWVVVIAQGGRIENAIEEPAGAISPKYLPPESLYVFSLR